MPTRLLRDGILESEAVCSLPWASEVLYRRLMSVVDDYGRFSAAPKLIRAKCYPLQIDKVSDSDVGKWLTQVVEAGLVRVYPAEDGKRYMQIVKFGQQVRSKSKHPAPPDSPCEELPAPDNTCKQLLADVHLDGVGVGDVNTSEANASDAAASVDKSEVESAKAALWRESVVVLKAGGCPESLCRSFMGKLVKDYTEATVREAVTAAISAQPADAREYLKATCQRLAGERKRDGGADWTRTAT